MAHMLTIRTGEDIIERIMSFSEKSSRGICILSANGAVCNAKIQPLGSNNRVLTFRDAYEIVSLSGTMLVNESGEVRNETGGWRISIGGVGGCIFAGSLAGSLIAASPVQVVLGSFCQLIENPSLERNNESISAIVTPTIPNVMGSAT